MVRSLQLYLLVALLTANSPVQAIGLSPFPGGKRAFQASAMDKATERIFVYGGVGLSAHGTPQVYDDLWICDTRQMHWAGPFTWPLGSGPGPLSNAQLAFRSPQNDLLLFGGSAPGSCSSGLWSLDLSTFSWRELLDGNEWPGEREEATLTLARPDAMAWLLFGNCVGSVPYGDYFSWSNADSGWDRHVEPGGLARAGHVAAFDVRRNRLLMYGGLEQSGALRLDQPGSNAEATTASGVWGLMLDSLQWVQLDGRRNDRSWAVGDYDALSDELLFFGGRSTGGGATDTISSDLRQFNMSMRRWRDVTLDPALRRWQASGHYCPCLGQFVVVGGIDAPSIGIGFDEVHDDVFAVEVERPATIQWRLDESPPRLVGRCSDLQVTKIDSVVLWDCHHEWRLPDLPALSEAESGTLLMIDHPSQQAIDAFNSAALVATWTASGDRVLGRFAPDSGNDWAFELNPTYPNPATGGTTFSYTLPKATDPILRLYGLSGRLVRTFPLGKQDAGPHEVQWDGRDDRGVESPSGVYFYRLEASGWSSQRKLVIVRG